MGNVEKLVVLTILFVCVVVLGISLTRESRAGEAEPGTQGPLGDLAQADAPEGSLPGSADEPGEVKPFLSSSLTPEPEAGVPAPALLPPAGSILVGLEGLEETSRPEFRLYRPTTQTTWAALSRRFYGEETYAWLLEVSNEELLAPAPGMSVLVPVYDFREELGDRPAAEPRPAGERYHVIASGDNLSSISKDYYGTSVRWNEIYEANRDVLADPDSLSVGTRLRIP